ncbi:MAG: RnfABCDGE type electron transport complex subunit D, partial [Bacteroidales bacterium]|nr:RnfABCDGE type electron transport complex subunit D [Bacteroidales bacterium]
MALLKVSGSPHVQSKDTTKSIMWSVVIALIPALLVGVYFFGFRVLAVTAVSVAACILFEWLIQKFLLKGEQTISDGSAVITGMLLAFNLPSNIPFYIVIIGALVAIGIGKMTFGGLGKNPFNPALVGRVFLFLSFPTNVAMSEWPIAKSVDALTGPTPLSLIKNGQTPELMDTLIGATGGSFGEVSAIAIILGGLFMLLRKVITWHIPVSFIASSWLFAGILYLAGITVDHTTHILAGGLMLGAIFM